MGFNTGSHELGATDGFGPTSFAAGDMDGDGFMDIAVARADPFTPVVRLRFNDGAGGLGFPIDVPAETFGGAVIALRDMDNDRDLDLVTGRVVNASGQGVIRVFPNDGTGRFLSFIETRLDNASPCPADLDLADFDGDGALDVATAAAILQIHVNAVRPGHVRRQREPVIRARDAHDL